MASKIAVIGNVDGQFVDVLRKLANLHTKNNFAFALVVGNLFASLSQATEDDAKREEDLIDGKVLVPCTTYFMLGNRALPERIAEKLAGSDDELCSNLHFLGKRTIMKTADGVKIVALGGQLDPVIMAGVSEDNCSPYYSETDAHKLQEATTADILVTSEWPSGILSRSKVPLPSEAQPQSRQCVADLAATLKPRYHFSSSESTFYEREPYFHLPTDGSDGLFAITRFISLAPYGNAAKSKWIYAFTIDPASPHAISPPSGATACPFTHPEARKRPALYGAESNLVYDDGRRGGRRAHKRRKGEPKGPIAASECFFCLANDNIQTHLITTIGENCYMTTAKGTLTTAQTFPRLGFAAHLLIIPLVHQPTLASMAEQERHDTYVEMQHYRASMNAMLKSTTREEYGSVTWEVSKSSLPHAHWQYLPVPTDLIRKKLVEGAFQALAENLRYPDFVHQDIGDGFEETSDYFRVLIWDPIQSSDAYSSILMRFDETVRFHLQFGREVLAKLLRLDERIDWRDCGQTQAEEEQDVARFKAAFKDFDFAAE